MRSRTARRRGPDARVALLALAMLVFVPATALAAGEDDPTFGQGGVAYLSLPTNASGGSATDQAPNGDIVTATVSNQFVAERGEGVQRLFVSRVNANGGATGLGGDGQAVVELPEVSGPRVFDVHAENDSVIVTGYGAHIAVPARGGDEGFWVAEVDANGNRVDGYASGGPDICQGKGPNGVPVAAQIASTTLMYVLWEHCAGSDDPVVTRYDAVAQTETSVPVPNQLERSLDGLDLAMGPNGEVFTLSAGWTCCQEYRLDLGTQSIVNRFSADLVPLNYGSALGGGGELAGVPVAFDVDGSGRAVVWLDEQVFTRGADDGSRWQFRRLDQNGQPDPTWGQGGLVELVGEPFGPVWSGCRRGIGACTGNSHVLAEPDGHVIAVGIDDRSADNRGSDPDGVVSRRTIVRLTPAGALDPTWDGDGIKTFAINDPADHDAELDSVSQPVLQADGKVLVPLVASSNRTGGEGQQRIPAPDISGSRGWALGVARLGLTVATPAPPLPPPPPPPPPPPAPAVAPAPVAAAAPPLAAPKPCTSRRRFTIRLRTGRRKSERSPIVSATVRVNGKKVKVSKTARRTARVSLRNLPKGRFSVSIRLRLRDGGIVRETRRYRTCAPKVERELAPLRTRAPKAKRRGGRR